jgi:hypothetical protein
MADKEDKSLKVQDSHQRALKLAKAPLTGLVIGVIEEIEKAPGASIVKNVFNESFKGLIEYFSEVKKDINNERFYELHQVAFCEEVSKEKQTELLKNFEKLSDQEYLNIVEAVMKDEETDKVKYYAKLFRVFLENGFDPKSKIFHLKAFKSLNAEDFNLLKTYYSILKEMNSREPRPMNLYQMQPSPRNKLETLESSKNAPIVSGIQRLINAGYVLPGNSNHPPSPNESIYEIFEVLE